MPYPVLLDIDRRPEAVFERAYDFEIRDQLLGERSGFEVASFRLPSGDDKAGLLQAERLLLAGAREFVIRVVRVERDDQGVRSVFVEAEASWYDLGGADPVEPFELEGVTAARAMEHILSGTDWTVGEVDPKHPSDFASDKAMNPLAVLRMVPAVWGGELWFDTSDRTVHLQDNVGQDRDVLFAVGKNIRSITRHADTRDLATRLYPYGKGGMTIADVNGGVPYLEHYGYFDDHGLERKVRVHVFSDEGITNPYYLLTRGILELAKRSWPKTTIEVEVSVDEGVGLGDRVWVHDAETGLQARFRISQRTLYPLDPSSNRLQLDQPLATLAEQLSRSSQPSRAAEEVRSTVGLELKDLSVFNLLLNSRAEQGLAHWQAAGFTVETGHGRSGSASFRCDAVEDKTYELRQTVYPASREQYVFSLQTDLSEVDLGTRGRVRIEVTFRYTDGTEETKTYPIAEGAET